jgi:LacI family transcriptional regulator
MANIKDIAREVGVSIGTVDRVLHNRGRVSEETKARIEQVMEELHYKPNHVAQGLAAAKKKLNLVYLVVDWSRNLFFYDVKIAAEKRAEKLKQYGVQVQILVLKVNYEREAFFSKEVKEALENADGVASVGLYAESECKVLRGLVKRNIPIVFYNCQAKDIDTLAFVGCDYISSGRLAAGLAALIGGKDARVAVFSQGYEESNNIESYDERMIGFEEERKLRYPQMKILCQNGIDLDTTKNEQTVNSVLKEYPDLNIVYVVNPADYEICETIKKADLKNKIQIITNDLVGRQIEMVENGTIAATICQEPEKQGEKPLDLLFQYLAYGIKPKEKNIFTKLSIHIAQNIQ